MTLARRFTVSQISSEDTIYAICTEYPQTLKFLHEFGFTQIKQPMMIQAVGRYMTLRKGCAMRGVDYGELACILQSKGLPIEE
jgi:hypothetical protein